MADQSSSAEPIIARHFAATPEELARIASAPLLAADAAGWQVFAALMQRLVIEAYQEGQVTLERALRVVRSCSVRCTWQERLTLMALTAQEALDHPPQAPQKKVENPRWIRRSAAQLVQMYREDRPLEAFAPNQMNNWTTPILEDAILRLRALDLCDDVTPRVLYGWYKEAKKAGVLNPDEVAPET